ncbi:MAG: hypothetical protein QOK35_2031 [Pseudonocardiales bacterium]|jgi:hypothetical protein|nr:hypothetical protein [Pseudonocardiales bacterium]
MTGWWNDDDELQELLRAALAEQRDTPARFVEAGKASFAWHSIDAELAALAYDSVTDAQATAGVRQTDRAAIRELTFAFRDATVHVQIARGGLHGQVVPPRRGEVELHVQGRQVRTAQVDDQGWFSFTPLPTTGFRLLWRIAGGGTAMTDWLTL